MRPIDRSVSAAFALWVALSATGASAATLSFDDLPFNPPGGGGDATPAPNTVLTDQYRDLGLLFGREGVSAGVAVVQFRDTGGNPADIGIAALDAAGVLPGTRSGANVGDMYFRFVLPGTDTPALAEGVRFRLGDAGGDVDIFEIRTYGPDGALVATQSFSDSSFRTVTIPTPFHRIEIDFTGDFGYMLDDLQFTVVPEPTGATVALLPAAGLLRRRRRAAVSRP